MSCEKFTFTEQNLDKAKEIVAKYPKYYQRSAVMPLLTLAQKQNNNYLSVSVIDYIAQYLSIPVAFVLEVATFYTMYNLKPIAKNHVQVCTNISCCLRGSDNILSTILSETEGNDNFTVEEVECLGACSNAPVIQVNDIFYEDLDVDTTKAVVKSIKEGIAIKSGSQMGRIGAEPFVSKE